MIIVGEFEKRIGTFGDELFLKIPGGYRLIRQ
jgi:hypothetical protein